MPNGRKSFNAEAASMKHYRNWSSAKDVAQDGSKDLAAVIKDAAHALDVAPKAFTIACRWAREPEKSVQEIRHLKRLAFEFGLVDADFNPLQTDLLDAIEATESVV
jgi:hypothetical protein